MLNQSRHQLAVLDDAHQLLGHSTLDKHALLVRLGVRQTDVDRARLGRDDGRRPVEALLGEVDLSRVGRVDRDGRTAAEDLDGERGRRGDGNGRDDRLEQD